VNPWLIAVITIIIVVIFVFVINRIVRAHRRQASTGKEELVGMTARVKIPLTPEGTVLIHGEHWQARLDTDGQVEAGEEVVVKKVNGLKLYVIKK